MQSQGECVLIIIMENSHLRNVVHGTLFHLVRFVLDIVKRAIYGILKEQVASLMNC